MLVIDANAFGDWGGELAAKVQGVMTVFTLGPANYGIDLLATIEEAGHATARCFARADDFATLNYTGGTTGKSKGALRYHREYGGFASAILADFEIPEAARYLTVAPISHVAGTKVLPTLMRGGTVHMLKGFDPEAVLKTIEQERINFTLFVPTMIYVLLDHPALARTDLSSLELLLYGASAMSPSRLVEGIERIGPVFSQLYGQTECYPVSVLRKADHDPAMPELFLSCGFPIAACEVKILDGDDDEVETGEAGEICVRAPHVMAEYWKRPETTEETLKNGWLHTGDIARKDERGYMFILDRKKDMIVSGGFNIFPREVEDVLSQHADVAMCAVVGVPDDKWGEAVTAVVVAREGTHPDADELINLVKARKGSAHAPKQIQFVEELPMTGVGKVDKKGAASALLGRPRADGGIARARFIPSQIDRQLLFREELRPHRAPPCGHRLELGRRHLVTFGTFRALHPALRAPHEHVAGRHQPAGVVERAGAKIHEFGPALARAVEPPPTDRAKPRCHLGSRRRDTVRP